MFWWILSVVVMVGVFIFMYNLEGEEVTGNVLLPSILMCLLIHLIGISVSKNHSYSETTYGYKEIIGTQNTNFLPAGSQVAYLTQNGTWAVCTLSDVSIKNPKGEYYLAYKVERKWNDSFFKFRLETTNEITTITIE